MSRRPYAARRNEELCEALVELQKNFTTTYRHWWWMLAAIKALKEPETAAERYARGRLRLGAEPIREISCKWAEWCGVA